MYIMNLQEIYAARKRIDGWVRKTPLEYFPFLSKLCKGEVWLKLENQQLTSSYKIRGALNKLFQISDEVKERGVVTASSGNHAQGVGYAAHVLGFDATIVVPRNTPKTKLEAIKQYEVELIVHGEDIIEAERLAQKIEQEKGQIYVSSYNDLDIIAGAGTIGLEMIEEKPDLDSVLVPVGGGGLISGVGCVFKEAGGEVEVVGVQSIASPVMFESIKKGHIIDMKVEESIAEGVWGGIEKGSITFNLCCDLVDDFILVHEKTIKDAIKLLIDSLHQVVEGAGAIGVAAIMENPERFSDHKVGVVVSGGNLDFGLLRKACC